MSWLDKILPSRIRAGNGNKSSVPEGLWHKCTNCETVIYHAEYEKNLSVCPKCNHHGRISARKRAEIFIDATNKEEIFSNISPKDILKFKLNSISNENLIIYGNLPYNISTKILIKWIVEQEKFLSCEKLILMFQKEVADRILAKTNSKNYGRLSIISNWKLDIKKEFNINSKCFFPKPKVNSTLLSFVPKKNFFHIKNPKNLEKITRIFFNQRRKMIKNPLKQIFKNPEKIIRDLELNTNLRPQNLNPLTYFNITKEYEQLIN